MPLTDTEVRSAKPRAKAYKLFDTAGLYLEVAPSGGRWWRLKFRVDGKEKRLSLGVYPAVGLKEARRARDASRSLLASGVDPSQHRKAGKTARLDRAANSFEVVAREWFFKHAPGWAPDHSKRVLRLFERDVFPWIGKTSVAEVTAAQLLAVLRRIEGRGAVDTTHRARANCGQVFRYAIATSRAERDPSTDLRGAVPPVVGRHFAAVTDPKELGALLRTLDAYQGTLVVSCALKLAPLVFVRPIELRTAEWAQIDLDTREWRFTVSKTKVSHIVPLASQAVSILRELQPLTGDGRFVFPSARGGDRPMSNNAILAAMRSLGITTDVMSGHGFRATARTVLDEVLGFRPDFIEHQLAHAVRDPNGRAYNRTAHLPERRKMMQAWADYLERLKSDIAELPIRAKG